jgi:ABC-2 type transport system permease protein
MGPGDELPSRVLRHTMKLPTLLRKELAWSRHHLGTLAVLLLILPAAFSVGTLFFQHTFPEHTPIAVVGVDGATEDDTDIVVAAITVSEFSDPVVYDSSERAFADLEREQVYAVVEVPGSLGDPETSSTIDLHVDGRITSYRVASTALVAILTTIDDSFSLPGDVTAERHVIGTSVDLPGYLLPSFLMIFLMLLAFAYVPYALVRERRALDRLRIESSVDAMLAAKFTFLVPLAAVSTLVVYVVGTLLGYPLQPISLPLVAAYLLTFLYLSVISVSITLLTGFSTTGRVVNVALFLVFVSISNLVYPAGFFSGWGRDVARMMPTHYSMIIARSHMLKGVDTGTFSEWWGPLVGFTLVTLLVLKLSVEWYKRGA